jgi:hypothetical protein
MKARYLWLAGAAAGLMTACIDTPVEPVVEGEPRIGLNRVGLNRIGLNRIGLNRIGLNRIGLNELDLGSLALTSLSPTQTDVMQLDQASSEIVTLEASIEQANDIITKWIRCWETDGSVVEVELDGDTDFKPGWFGIKRLADLGYDNSEVLECMGACLAVHANDRVASVNFTAQVGPYYVNATAEEAAEYYVPGVMTAYRIDATSAEGDITDGKYLFNTARIDLSPGAKSWLAGGGMTPPPNLTSDQVRTCRDAALARANPMPDVCGGKDSTVLEGAQTWQQMLWEGVTGNRLCSTTLYDAGLADALIDREKGAQCYSVGRSSPWSGSYAGQPFTCAFHADLPASGPSLNDIIWDQVAVAFIDYPQPPNPPEN